MNEPVQATVDDLPEITALCTEVFRRNAPPEHAMDRDFPRVFSEDNLAQLWVIRAGDKIAAHIAGLIRTVNVYGASVPVGSIGAVCTREACRGQGLATRLLHRMMAHIVQHGGVLMFVSGGRGMYRRAGCCGLGLIHRCRVPPQDHDEVPVAECGADELGVVLSLSQAEPVRFVRAEADLRAALETGMAANRSWRTWLLGEHEEAYIVGHRREDTLVVEEFGGERHIVAHGVQRLMAQYEAAHGVIGVGHWDVALRGQLAGCHVEDVHIPGTIKILQPEHLLRKLEPYLEERMGRPAPTSCVRSPIGWHVAIGERQAFFEAEEDMARFLLGAPGCSRAPEWEGVLPVPLPAPTLPDLEYV
ncbi:MAG: GNAT family N-acetyltransferase [Kiritimatiellae bacterium]|nr:GNAT family N-acetyltransferase [Kiritimatiellia bacterium]